MDTIRGIHFKTVQNMLDYFINDQLISDMLELVFSTVSPNWLGLPVTTFALASGAFNAVRQPILELAGTGRNKMTYYPSKRVQQVSFDLNIEDNSNDTNRGRNPPAIQIVGAPDTPKLQLYDILIDVNVTRWGFHQAITFKELLISDQIFCAEHNAKIAAVKPRIEIPTHIEDLKSAVKDIELKKIVYGSISLFDAYIIFYVK